MKLVIFFSFLGVAMCAPQRPTQYKFLTNRRPQYYVQTNNQYRSDALNYDDGQYRHDNSGDYNPDGSGAYTHSDVPYVQQAGYRTGYVRKVTPVNRVYTPVNVGNAKGLYDNRHYAILRQIQDAGEDGYHYVYETENGIQSEEEGHLENKGSQNEFMSVRGYYTYTGPDNVVYRVDYTVGEDGYNAAGAHLPTTPATV